MAGNIAIEEVVKAALIGIGQAQTQYSKWSGGDWLWRGHEYVSTVFLAKELGDLQGAKYVTVENSASGAIVDAGARGRGKLHHKIRGDGRFDLLLWWGDGTPRAPIEVKLQVTGISKITADLHRIEKALIRKQNESSLQFGMLVFYSSSQNGSRLTAIQKLESRLSSIKGAAKELIKDCSIELINNQIQIDGDSAWVAAAIVLKPIATTNQ